MNDLDTQFLQAHAGVDRLFARHRDQILPPILANAMAEAAIRAQIYPSGQDSPAGLLAPSGGISV